MLEPLVSSKIRRTLLEHILRHPDDRFYLRGLAKELGLAVSPVRRELKRLEQLGVLKTYQEANIRFYVVDQTCPLFIQLKQAWGQTLKIGDVSNFSAPTTKIETSPIQIEWIRRARRPRLSLPTLVGALSLIMGTFLFFAGFFWLKNRNVPLFQVTVIESEPSISTLPASLRSAQAGPTASGEMRSVRWRLLPGSIGGLSRGTN